MLCLILNGNIKGEGWIGRKMLSCLRNLQKWTGLTAEELNAIQNLNGCKEIINKGVVNSSKGRKCQNMKNIPKFAECSTYKLANAHYLVDLIEDLTILFQSLRNFKY